MRTSVSSAYEMLGRSICSLLTRSFISLATSMLFPEDTSLTCTSERRLGTAPAPISGQSRPAVWPRCGRQPGTPLRRKTNAMLFHRGADAEKSGSWTSVAAPIAVRDILHLQPLFVRYSTAACNEKPAIAVRRRPFGPLRASQLRIYPLVRHCAEPSTKLTCIASPLRDVLRETDVPGAIMEMIPAKSPETMSGLPLIAASTSPCSIPAAAAGLPGSGCSKIAP